MRSFLNFLLLFQASFCFAQTPKVSLGIIKHFENFPSKYVTPRNVNVWLPPNYTPTQKYAVLYMHDGQMLFDSTITWNRQEWKVDEVMSRLLEGKLIRNCIVVGINNVDKLRYTEYVPQRVIELLPDSIRKTVAEKLMGSPALADNYLKFLVKELKPFIDKEFSTFRNVDNTFIMGASMGGLISLYALCEYPRVFGGAGCISTHTPIISPAMLQDSFKSDAPKLFRDYLNRKLPRKNTHKIYFDHGNLTLDALYKPYQNQIDTIFKNKGYDNAHWQTHEFIGDKHDEISWARRLHIPLTFLLKPTK